LAVGEILLELEYRFSQILGLTHWNAAFAAF